MAGWRKLGIIAGGGALPVRLAEGLSSGGIDYFIIALTDFADAAVEKIADSRCCIGEVGKIIKTLKINQCDAVVLAGNVKRPDFSHLEVDFGGVALIPKILAAAAKGDGAILSVVVQALEKSGFTVVGAETVVSALAVSHGPFGVKIPTSHDWLDIRKGAAIIKALGPFDVGQGAVVASGFVLAIEAAEGTDSMLARCASLPTSMKGESPNGVLVKCPKPKQELRVDLPTIGLETVARAAAANLNGIAVEANRTIALNPDELAAEADRLGIFVYAFSSDELF
jgi:DUF1009 family protein